MRNIAIIPARSGSKGLKDKNIKELNGKPLMAYTIEAALESGVFDCVHVSTDSEKYAEIGRQFGASISTNGVVILIFSIAYFSFLPCFHESHKCYFFNKLSQP